MGQWKSAPETRQIGRPKGQLNHKTRLSKQIDQLMHASALKFIKQVIAKALEGSAMHERMYWDELTKRDSPLLQLMIQNNINGKVLPSLIVNFKPADPRPEKQPVTTIEGVVVPDAPAADTETNVVPMPRQGFIRSVPRKLA